MMDPQQVQSIIANSNFNEKCDVLHAGDCNMKAFIQFLMGAKSVFKMYLVAHLIPFLLFKLKSFRKK